jgi:hypothetical protein
MVLCQQWQRIRPKSLEHILGTYPEEIDMVAGNGCFAIKSTSTYDVVV